MRQKEAIDALIQASEERIRKDMVTKRDLEVNNNVLATLFKVELAKTNKQVAALASAMKVGLQETQKKIDQTQKH